MCDFAPNSYDWYPIYRNVATPLALSNARNPGTSVRVPNSKAGWFLVNSPDMSGRVKHLDLVLGELDFNSCELKKKQGNAATAKKHIIINTLNPCRAQFILGNIKIFLLFLLIISQHWKGGWNPSLLQGPASPAWLISWLLVTWNHKEKAAVLRKSTTGKPLV